MPPLVLLIKLALLLTSFHVSFAFNLLVADWQLSPQFWSPFFFHSPWRPKWSQLGALHLHKTSKSLNSWHYKNFRFGESHLGQLIWLPVCHCSRTNIDHWYHFQLIYKYDFYNMHEFVHSSPNRQCNSYHCVKVTVTFCSLMILFLSCKSPYDLSITVYDYRRQWRQHNHW